MSCGTGRNDGMWRQAHRDALAWRIRLAEEQISAVTLKQFSAWYRGALNKRAWHAEEQQAARRAAMVA